MTPSLETIIDTHGAALLAYATRLTRGDRYRAEDVVQETWVKAWRHLDRLTENHGSVRSWLMRVARNIVIDQYRSRQIRPTEVEMPEVDHTAAPEPADDVLNRMVVGSVLDSLSEEHRRTVIEVYFADRTAAAAANALDVPVGTVKSRVHKALRVLRATMPAPAALEAA